MRDAYLQTKPNPWKGRWRDEKDHSKGKDERETITEIFMEFLTEHQVEINGSMMPGFARYRATASVADGSNLRKFLKAWFPALKDEDFARFDADKLVGKGAYITVAHNVGKDGNTYANIVGAMQPPKGSALPAIPKDFVRHEDREKAAAQAAPVAQQPVATSPQGEDDLPF